MRLAPRSSPLCLCLVILAIVLPLWVRLPIDTFVQSASDAEPVVKFELKPGDHICIIGNTLADRMQHDGWLETMLQSRYPKHELVIRNLGFSGWA